MWEAVGLGEGGNFFSVSTMTGVFSIRRRAVQLCRGRKLVTPGHSTNGAHLFTRRSISQLRRIVCLARRLNVGLTNIRVVFGLGRRVTGVRGSVGGVFSRAATRLSQRARRTGRLSRRDIGQLSHLGGSLGTSAGRARTSIPRTRRGSRRRRRRG